MRTCACMCVCFWPGNRTVNAHKMAVSKSIIFPPKKTLHMSFCVCVLGCEIQKETVSEAASETVVFIISLPRGGEGGQGSENGGRGTTDVLEPRELHRFSGRIHRVLRTQ